MEAMKNQSERSNPVQKMQSVVVDAVSQSISASRGHEQKSFGCRFGKASTEQEAATVSQYGD